MEAIKFKYIPKLITALTFLFLLILIMCLFMGRTIDFLKFDFITQQYPDFYFNVSNFAISYFIYAGVGYLWLMLGVNFKFITALGIFLILANLIYELWIPLLNTPDIIDAYFGFAGTLIAFAFLWLSFKFGFKLNTEIS